MTRVGQLLKHMRTAEPVHLDQRMCMARCGIGSDRFQGGGSRTYALPQESSQDGNGPVRVLWRDGKSVVNGKALEGQTERETSDRFSGRVSGKSVR